MGPDLDGDVFVANQMQVGMMGFGFCEFADTIEKVQPLEKVFDFPVFADPLILMGEVPAG